MSQRDTLNPVCRVVNVAANATAVVTLKPTAASVTAISTLGSSDGSGYADNADFIVSCVPQAGWGGNQVDQASAQVTVSAAGIIKSGPGDGDLTGVPSSMHITSAGGYGLISGTLGLSSLHSQNAAGVPGSVAGHVSGAAFTVTLGPPTYAPTYVTVTDVSGGGGFFRVQPGSGQGYYLSGDGTMKNGAVAGVSTSGIPGALGGAGDTVTLTLQSSMAVTDIIIENHLTQEEIHSAADFLITYGSIKQANTNRDQQRPDVV